jgi:hypothetical protein
VIGRFPAKSGRCRPGFIAGKIFHDNASKGLFRRIEQA